MPAWHRAPHDPDRSAEVAEFIDRADAAERAQRQAEAEVRKLKSGAAWDVRLRALNCASLARE
jgi:hypothetical protein